ncbi:hypothetical protein P775_19550 [Puniceibacterium antarcticum]|uniref:Uncharacterized protein n=1 Tax=Puniceibacterium antarcticum TaxID=1206336 RepID=A0A2G8RB28_9RHOB|nr:DUF6477 family protein [Puniceibacterium antarcticum]PIL18766.1 hypothetical protein P775_19550 [Puniceibacterium antarcticum]
MTDALRMLESIRRPRLLIRTARIGMADYRRSAQLQRLLGVSHLPDNGTALRQLITIEEGLEQQRSASAAGYSLSRHIEVLVAMMGEAQLLRASGPITLIAAE